MKSKNNKKKNRGMLIVLALVVFLGVGYAIITGDPLNISGSAHTDDFKVIFDKNHTNVIKDNTGTAQKIATYDNGLTGDDQVKTQAGYASTDGEHNATFELYGFQNAGDTAYISYKILNNSSTYFAKISLTDSKTNIASTNATGTNNFTVSYAFSDTEPSDLAGFEAATYNAYSGTAVSTAAGNYIAKKSGNTAGVKYLLVKVSMPTVTDQLDEDDGINVTVTMTPNAENTNS